MRPSEERGSRSLEISSNMSVSFHGRRKLTHIRVVREFFGRAPRDETTCLEDGDLINTDNRCGPVGDHQNCFSLDEAGES